MAVKAGKSTRFRSYRRQRWVDSGEGVVRLKTKVIRRRRGEEAPRKDPGPWGRCPGRRIPATPGSRSRSAPTTESSVGSKPPACSTGRASARGQVRREQLAKMGMKKAVLSLTRPQGQAKLIGSTG